MFTLSRTRLAAAMTAVALALFAGSATAVVTTSPALAALGQSSQTHA